MTDKKNVPALAIFDADSPPALSFVRSLGRARIPFCIYSSKSRPVARFSRYTNAFEKCPGMEDAEQFSTWLRGKLSSRTIRLIAPTSDLMCFHIADNREFFEPDIQDRIPETDKIFSVIFKDRFHEVCVSAGQSVPWTLCPASIDEVLATVNEMPFPLILKPKSHVVVGLARGRVVSTPKDLLEHFVPYDISESNRLLADRFPEHRLPMIQERIPGDFKGFLSISGILSGDGETIAISAGYKTGQWPKDMGIGISFKASDNMEVIQRGAALTKKLLGRGLFELEMIYHSGLKDYVALDLNPRSFGQVTLDVARGNNLPLLWYRTMTGEDVSVQSSPKQDYEWIHCIPYHLDKIARCVKGPDRRAVLEEYLRVIKNPHVDVLNDIGDPLPSLPFTLSLFRHPRALMREMWRGRTLHTSDGADR